MRVLDYLPVSTLVNTLQRDLQEEFNTLSRTKRNPTAWIPSMDIFEEDDRIVISADLPGLDTNDIEVYVDNGRLTIKGERTSEHRTGDNKNGRFERTYGSFARSFDLPDTADVDNVTASSKNGVLEIVVKKQEVTPMKRITVHTDTPTKE
ncbi:MAG: Hsp20/alpha crystallin family protein [Gammaproteobacteria bacterium]|nr:Hsp20/alpha crystallin family protein [Gammaproteobacteria bacterium]MDE0252022.1 Hsp20/alpha crystallin family protein [Gammaproteobacteria bacterium]MDE0402870.1 Hsp20/alpha crystallin family protein [Gammaproteobacteria bacterium]